MENKLFSPVVLNYEPDNKSKPEINTRISLDFSSRQSSGVQKSASHALRSFTG